MLYNQCLSLFYKGRVLSISRRVFHSGVSFRAKKLPDPWDLATGLERKVMIEYAKGNTNPFLMNPLKRGPGTKDCPNVVLSFTKQRLIGCHCHPDNLYIQWWWLHECYPRRCDCNYWFVLKKVESPSIYEC